MPATSPTHRHDPPMAREAEALYLTLLDRMGMACVALDRDFRVRYCNPAYTSLVGLTLTELLGQTLPLALPEFNGSPGHQACLRAMQMQLPQEIEQTIGPRFLQYRVYLTPEGVLAVIDDVTPRRQLEEDLVLSVLRSRLILEQVPAVHWTIDQDLRFTLSMGAGLRDINLRPGQVIGKTLYEFFDTNDPHHPQVLHHRQALEGRRITYTADFGGRTYDCVLEPLRDHDRQIVGVIGLAHDITDRKRADEERQQLERQIFRTQKLESLGLLASGVAHDFNNLLVGILGTAEVLLRDLPGEAPQRSLVELLKKAGENAADLIRQMLVYAGKSPGARKSLDLNGLIRESQPLVSAAVRKSITMETRLAPELPILQGDSSQIQQVILNLVLNAAEATRRKGGTITLRTGTLLIDPPLAEGEGDLALGPYVFFEVTDDGCGMSPEVLARIFDPFFTTKAAGRGLGMSVVQRIVRTHCGGIQVRSVLGEGTTFRVLLPVEDSPGQEIADRNAHLSTALNEPTTPLFNCTVAGACYHSDGVIPAADPACQ